MSLELSKIENLRLYTAGQVALGTLIAGPFMGCWFISRNYLVMGDERRSWQYLILGCLILVLMTFAILFLPGEIFDQIPSSLIPVISASVMYGHTKHCQKIQPGCQKQTYLRCLIYSVVTLLIFLMAVMVLDFSNVLFQF